jgi:hypothetical protein
LAVTKPENISFLGTPLIGGIGGVGGLSISDSDEQTSSTYSSNGLAGIAISRKEKSIGEVSGVHKSTIFDSMVVVAVAVVEFEIK